MTEDNRYDHTKKSSDDHNENEHDQQDGAHDFPKEDENDREATDQRAEELSEEEQDELLKKYDAESNTRQVKGIVAGIVFILLLGFSLFQLYTGAFGQYTAY